MKAEEIKETAERARLALANAKGGFRMGNPNWDKEKHPRGEAGRFAPKGAPSPTPKPADGDPKAAAAGGKRLFHDISEGDKVWITQHGDGEIYTVKSFDREPHRFDGGMFTLVDGTGHEVKADSAWVNKAASKQ